MPKINFTPDKQVIGESKGLDLSSAPIPTRRYAAELCNIRYVNGEAKLIFAQSDLLGESIDSAVQIRMNPISVLQFSQSLQMIQNPSVEQILDALNVDAQELSVIGSSPSQIANMFSNIVSCAIAGYDTCLDFYNATPFSMKKSEGKDELEIEPVVRIEMRTTMFVALMRELFVIEGEIMKTFEEVKNA